MKAIEPPGRPNEAAEGAFRIYCTKCDEMAFSYSDFRGLNNQSEWVSYETEIDFIHQNRVRIQAILFERRLFEGARPPLIYVKTKKHWPFEGDEGYAVTPLESLVHNFPTEFSERRNRALLNISRMSSYAGAGIEIDAGTTPYVLFGRNDTEANFVLESLITARLIESSSKLRKLTPEGWNEIAELTRRGRNPRQNPVFVAMGFGVDDDPKVPETSRFMDKLFDDVIHPAVSIAGYRCQRVDRDHHTDYIMDKVMAMTRVAPFVVADFTLNSKGVYFEAGFARGLDLRVIHTCRESHKKQLHFDTAQINTIFWREPADLAQRLTDRIVGTMGHGPYPLDGTSRDA